MSNNYSKSKLSIPIKSLYSSKHLIFIINFFLICIVLILALYSAHLYYYKKPATKGTIPAKISTIEEDNIVEDPDFFKLVQLNDQEVQNEKYSIISSKNLFSPERKEWSTRVVIPKPVNVLKKQPTLKKKPTRKPRKIVLHGIVIAGSVKKALINNPKTGFTKKRNIYVVEGEEFEGYKVTSIESDHIKLDWEGEEIIINLYFGPKAGQMERATNFNSNRNTRNNRNQRPKATGNTRSQRARGNR